MDAASLIMQLLLAALCWWNFFRTIDRVTDDVVSGKRGLFIAWSYILSVALLLLAFAFSFSFTEGLWGLVS